VSTEGHELYELLVKPAIGWIHGRTKIIVETDNALESIPFEALLDGDGQYVGDSFEIEYSAGLFFLNENQRPQVIARASRALIVGESFGDQGAGLNGLPDARGEAREVAARFDSPVLLLDGEAQLARIINELPNAQVFHFAGHAIESGRFSGLLLASPQNEGGPRFLDAHYFSTSKFRDARVVVFSACSTANGSGEGLNDRDSLTRTAISAGVSNVLASRWIVDSAATREWMRSFYDRAVNGDLVSSAAKQARIKIRTTKEWRHPFFWASFSVFV
jgi:CHAT domain-containing protein